MDVPTRQAFMAEIFDEEERVRAFAVTNTFRSLAGLPGPLLVGAMLSSGLLGMPFVLSGAVKAGYDSSIYLTVQGQGHVKGFRLRARLVGLAHYLKPPSCWAHRRRSRAHRPRGRA